MTIDAIGIAQFSMIQEERRLQAISQNISNMQTPGYKRQILENRPFDSQLNFDFSTIEQSMQVANILQQGTLVQTQNPRDLALSGHGFFAVQTKEGFFYTRRGELQVNEQGELTTLTGALILGLAGPIQVDDNEFTIDTLGQVYIDNQKIDQLSLVELPANQDLHYQGQGLYASSQAAKPAESTQVLQGFIERANVQSVDEILAMIKTSQHFAALQRVMHTADNLLAQAIQQLGEGNV